MKREIKFRGKVHSDNLELLESIGIKHEKGWVTGSFIAPDLIVGDLTDVDVDYFATEWWISVIPETIGQFTGLKDRNGVEIYEGDVIAHKLFPNDVEIVQYKDGAFRVGQLLLSTYHCSVIKRVGNIHDNRELFEL